MEILRLLGMFLLILAVSAGFLYGLKWARTEIPRLWKQRGIKGNATRRRAELRKTNQ